MHAVREWSIDFVEQSQINNARNWMVTVCHEIRETVSLERCKCGERCEQCGGRPAPAINVRKSTSGRHHLARLALKVKASEPSVKAAIENVKEKREKIQHPREAVKKTKTQADIKHIFSDPSHCGGSRVGISAASHTNPFQALILRQEVDHDLMPMDTYEGSSKQARCDIVATKSSAPSHSPRDCPLIQLKVSLPLLQAELDQMQIGERGQHGEELFVDKDTLSSLACAPSPRHSTLVSRHKPSMRALGLRHDVFDCIGPPELGHQAIRDCVMEYE